MKKIRQKLISILGIPIQIEYWTGGLPIEHGDEKYEDNVSVYGRYYSVEHKILIRDDLPKERQKLIVAHELVHLCDDLICVRDDGEDLSESECDRIALMIYAVNGVK
jgi:hypothetical protein